MISLRKRIQHGSIEFKHFPVQLGRFCQVKIFARTIDLCTFNDIRITHEYGRSHASGEYARKDWNINRTTSTTKTITTNNLS